MPAALAAARASCDQYPTAHLHLLQPLLIFQRQSKLLCTLQQPLHVPAQLQFVARSRIQGWHCVDNDRGRNPTVYVIQVQPLTDIVRLGCAGDCFADDV